MEPLNIANFNSLASALDNTNGYFRDINIEDAYLATGARLGTATAPSQAASGADVPLIRWAAAGVVPGVIRFRVPGDYASSQDALKIVVTASMTGAPDTPTLTVAGSSQRRGVSGSSALTVVGVTPAISGTVTAEYVADLSGNTLKPGDVVTLTLTPSAHATKELLVWGVAARYKSTTALSELAAR